MGIILEYVFLYLFTILISESTGKNFTRRDSFSCKYIPVHSSSLRERTEKNFLCYNLTTVKQLLKNIPDDVTVLTIENSVLEKNDNFVKITYENLNQITIKNSEFGPLMPWLETLPNLEKLTLRNSSVFNIMNIRDEDVPVIDFKVANFNNLKVLNISNSSINNMFLFEGKIPHLPQLYLAENSFNCDKNFIWLLNAYEEQMYKIDVNNSVCFLEKRNDRTNYNIKSLNKQPLLEILDFQREAKYNCPPRCKCEFLGVTFGRITINRPLLNVDCISLNLTEIPKIVPRRVSRCNFSGNLIEDLSPLYENELYDEVSLLDLGYNRISHLDPVMLLKRPNVYYLFHHNKLSKFPAKSVGEHYDMLDENMNRPQMVLHNNPFICSCDYLSDFQKLIYRNSYEFPQNNEIHCYMENGEDKGSILTIDYSEICSKEPLLQTLDLVNIILSLIFLLLVADFVYNYRQYRKHRKLPWVINIFQSKK